MEIAVICLVAVGIVLVAVSFFVKQEPAVEKIVPEAEVAAAKEKYELMYHTVEGELMDLQGQVENALEHYVENRIDRTKDALNTTANEKIMAIDDYSKVVMEEIQTAHKEAMFLYNMLNDKEKTVKALISQRMVQPQPVAMGQPIPMKPEGKKMNRVQQEFAEATFGEIDPEPFVMQPPKQEENRVNRQIQAKSVSSIDEDLERIIRELQAENPAAECSKEPEPNGTLPVMQAENAESAMDSRNQQILAYYKNGMSYTEIARQMRLGTGEVKLVIDLFQSGID